ncbi:MAG: hypothetical protein Q7J16_06515 [Candidatus Cloacimonadales bacterium]|nr:hypothetical protein [Candidatus Cloacimonadales bacterium]
MFKTNSKIYGILLLIALALLSCTDEKTTEPINEITLLALQLGNYWVYHYNTIQDTLRETVAEAVEVEVDDQTKTVFRIAMANLNRYYFNDEVGLHFIMNLGSVSGADSLVDYSYLLYQYPVEINDSWFQDFLNDGYTSGDNIVQCISTSTIVDCPAGTFDCIVYKTSNPELSENYSLNYYCAGSGLIQSIRFDSDNNEFEAKTLVEYFVQE